MLTIKNPAERPLDKTARADSDSTDCSTKTVEVGSKEAPSSKLQKLEKYQASKFQAARAPVLELGCCPASRDGAWTLEPGRWSLELACFLILASIFTGCTPPGPRALLQGKRLIERGKYSEAVEKLRMATALLATNAQAWNYLGLACHYSRQAAEAEKAYQRALLLDRDLTEAHYNLGCLWLAQPKPESAKLAKTEFTAYTLRRGNAVEGLVKLGVADLCLRDPIGAEKSFGDALRLQSKNPEAWNGLGLARLQRGHASEAAQAFTSALKLQPDYRPALLNLAIISQQYSNNRAFALQKYREYLALTPPPDGFEAVKAVVRQLEEDLNPPARPVAPSPAVQTTTNTTVSKPIIITHSKTLATNTPRVVVTPKSEPPPKPDPATNLPKPPQPVSPPPSAPEVEVVRLPAEQVFKPAQDVAAAPPSSAPSRPASTAESSIPPPLPLASSSAPKPAKPGFFQRVNPLNLFHSEAKTSSRLTPLPPAAGSPTTELTSISSAERNPPATSEDLLPSSGDAPKAFGVPTTARYAYKSPAKPAPGNRAEAERAFRKGLQAQQEQRSSDALAAYRRAAELDPSFFEAQYNLGLAATAAGDLRTASAAYEEALAIRPDSLDARYNFALVLRQRNCLADAANELEKVAASDPKDTRANLALGNLYAQHLRQPAKARQHYLKVLEADPQHPQGDAIRYWLTSNPL